MTPRGFLRFDEIAKTLSRLLRVSRAHVCSEPNAPDSYPPPRHADLPPGPVRPRSEGPEEQAEGRADRTHEARSHGHLRHVRPSQVRGWERARPGPG